MTAVRVLCAASGFAALGIEVLWFRALELVLGASPPALAAVVSGYMGGMALGTWAVGWALERRRWGPGPALVAAHAGIAASAVPLALASWAHPAAQGALRWGGGAGGALAAALAAVPAAAVLPALAAGTGTRTGRLPSLYGWLVVGGAAGLVATGCLGIEALGLRGSAAGLALVAAAAALGFGRVRRGALPWEGGAEDTAAAEAPLGWGAAALGFAFGFLTLGLEVLTARLLTPVVGVGVYGAVLSLAPFLLGLGAGGWVAARFRPERGPWCALAATAGFSALAWALARLPEATLRLALHLPPSGVWWGDLTAAQVVCVLVVVLPGTLWAGTLLPLLWRSARRSTGAFGTVVAANTAGAVLGPLAANASLVPRCGVFGSYKLLAAGYAVVAGAWWACRSGPRRAGAFTLTAAAAIALLSAAPAPPPMVWHAGVYWAAPRYARMLERVDGKPGPLDPAGLPAVLQVIEGPVASVVVAESRGQRFLVVDGKPASNTLMDQPTQVFLARLPLLVRPAAKRVLVIGWGSGQTVAEVLRFPVERVTCVEISPEVVAAAPWFRAVNAGVREDPRFTLVVDDARHYLATTPERFDVIISQPSNPWVGASWSLFTREFLAICRERLTPGGTLVQWFQAYGTSAEDWALFEATFASVFPSWTLWAPRPGDAVFLTPPAEPDALPAEAGGERGAYVGWFERGEAVPPGEVNTDDRPVLAFRTARHLFTHAVRVGPGAKSLR
ncbi:spermidine synthase [Deferrisoma sp.]